MAREKTASDTGELAEILPDGLFDELSPLIEKSRQKAVSRARSAVTILLRQVGIRINDEILHRSGRYA